MNQKLNYLLSGLAIAGTIVCHAAPTGERVIHGGAQFERDGQNMTVHAQDCAVVGFDTFDILHGEAVRFVQPSRDAKVLARIYDTKTSHIDGHLLANGQLYLVNPFGIFFGKQAVVQTAALYAIAGSFADESFFQREHDFTQLTGRVINEGRIESNEVCLAGRFIQQRGDIVCNEGTALLVAGEDVHLWHEEGQVRTKISAFVPSDDPGIENSGTVSANHCTLAAGDLYSLAIDHSGLIRAKEIRIAGGETGKVMVAGELDATTSEKGGSIQITGEKIGIKAALIDASGPEGGGEVLIGGSYKGQGPLPNAQQLVVTQGTKVKANATDHGDGGLVIFWSDKRTFTAADIEARGGSFGGNGGFVETSSGDALQIPDGFIDTFAPKGTAGTWLLDPDDIIIVAGGGNNPSCAQVFFSTDPGSSYSINLSAIQNSSCANVILQANNNISETVGNITIPTTKNLNFVAGSTITLENVSTNGAINFTGASTQSNFRDPFGSIITGALTATQVSLVLDGTSSNPPQGSITVNGVITANGSIGLVNVLADNSTQLGSNSVSMSGVTSSGTIRITGANQLTIAANQTFSSQGSLTITGFESATIGANVTLNSTLNGASGGVNVSIGSSSIGSGTLSLITNATTAGINWSGTIDGNTNISINNTGTTSFTGTLGSTTPIGTASGAAITISASSGSVIFNELVTARSGVVQNAGAGEVFFNNGFTYLFVNASGQVISHFHGDCFMSGTFTIGQNADSNNPFLYDGNTTMDTVTYNSQVGMTFGTSASNTFTVEGSNTIDTTAAVVFAPINFNAKMVGPGSLTINQGGPQTTAISGGSSTSTIVSDLTVTGGALALNSSTLAFGNITVTSAVSLLLSSSTVQALNDAIFTGVVTGRGKDWNVIVGGDALFGQVNLSGATNAAGGDFLVLSTGGTITALDVNTSGSARSGGAGTGFNGGSISMLALQGSVVVGTLNSSGGAGNAAAGGNGGTISLQPSGLLTRGDQGPHDLRPLGFLVLSGNITAAAGAGTPSTAVSGDINLAVAGLPNVPSVASIYSESTGGTLTFTARNVFVGINEIMTFFENVAFTATGTMTLGRSNVLGNFSITSPNIILDLTSPASTLNNEGILIRTAGTHVVASGTINWTPQSYSGSGVAAFFFPSAPITESLLLFGSTVLDSSFNDVPIPSVEFLTQLNIARFSHEFDFPPLYPKHWRMRRFWQIDPCLYPDQVPCWAQLFESEDCYRCIRTEF